MAHVLSSGWYLMHAAYSNEWRLLDVCGGDTPVILDEITEARSRSRSQGDPSVGPVVRAAEAIWCSETTKVPFLEGPAHHAMMDLVYGKGDWDGSEEITFQHLNETLIILLNIALANEENK